MSVSPGAAVSVLLSREGHQLLGGKSGGRASRFSLGTSVMLLRVYGQIRIAFLKFGEEGQRSLLQRAAALSSSLPSPCWEEEP